MANSNTLVKSKTAERVGRTTLSQVAEESGVSIGAVSQVLNGSRTATRVSPATRERIMKVAADLHYTPNAVARSLRRSRTDLIAFHNAQDAHFKPTYPFYAAILEGIHEGCALHQKDLLTHANFKYGSDEEVFLGLHNGQIDGLLLYARTITPLVQRLIESHLPVVTIAEKIPGVPYVGIDEQEGGRLLARHLAERGFKRVLYRTIEERIVPTTQLQRKDAFCNEARQLGMSVRSTSYPYTAPYHFPTPEELALLQATDGTRPEVVVGWGDVSADGLASWCRQNGIRVPQDLAIVGFDGFPSPQRPSLDITTILAPWSDVARTAVGLLVDLCEGREVPQRTILPVELHVGETT